MLSDGSGENVPAGTFFVENGDNACGKTVESVTHVRHASRLESSCTQRKLPVRRQPGARQPGAIRLVVGSQVASRQGPAVGSLLPSSRPSPVLR